MFRKFKFCLRTGLLSFLYAGTLVSSGWGFLTRQEAFSQSFDLVWSTVHESHWDNSFGGRDWEAIRNDYRPKLERVRNRAQLVALLQSMLNELDLSHFRILSSYAKSNDSFPRGGYVGIDLKYLDGRAYVTRVAPGSPADEAGIEVGWRLKSIHNRSVKRLSSQFTRKDFPERLETFYIQRYLNEVIQGGTIKRIRTDWYPPDRRALKKYLMPIADTRPLSDPVGYLSSQRIEYEYRYLENGVLYVRFNYFLPNLMQDIRETLEEAEGKATGVILDLRSNLGGLSVMATGITGLLVDEPTNLGKLIMKKGRMTYQGFPQRKRFNGPLAVLLDGSSASTSEMLAAGLQEAGRAKIFGETSLGQSLPSLFKKLPSGDILQYAVGDYLTPGGYRIEKNGVIPNKMLVPDFDDLSQGQDIVLLEANRWIEEEVNE